MFSMIRKELSTKFVGITFDVGGILVPEADTFIEKRMIEMLQTSLVEFRNFKNRFSTAIYTGSITLKEFYTEVVDLLGSDINPDALVSKHLELYKSSSVKISKEVVELINTLKSTLLVSCLTNTEIEIAEYNKGKGLFNIFSNVYLSVELGLSKPDIKIYQYILDDIGCHPDEMIFIDDRKEYIGTANAIGIKCHHYRSYNELIDFLEANEVI